MNDRYRARKHKVRYEKIDKNLVYDRDGWKCYICGIFISPSPGYDLPYNATLDHVIPMSKGGDHTYDNVRACCYSCNQKKDDSL